MGEQHFEVPSHSRNAVRPAKRVLVTGSSGLVGSALVSSLASSGYGVVRLVRGRSTAAGEAASWDPVSGRIDTASLEGLDAVVHLAGERIDSRRWSPGQKELIRTSRVAGTRLLCDSLARLANPPEVVVAASAVGYYGDRGDSPLSETSGPGNGFLPDVCREWEAATEPATAAGMRVVNLRMGVVLSAAGGALARLLWPVRLGVAGKLGTGRQYMSWIAIDDLVGAIDHAISHAGLRGPVNAVSPNPVTNGDFIRRLARSMSRPAWLAVPAFAARLVFGEMADALLLASARVVPARLIQSNYHFHFPTLDGALGHILGKCVREADGQGCGEKAGE